MCHKTSFSDPSVTGLAATAATTATSATQAEKRAITTCASVAPLLRRARSCLYVPACSACPANPTTTAGSTCADSRRPRGPLSEPTARAARGCNPTDTVWRLDRRWESHQNTRAAGDEKPRRGVYHNTYVLSQGTGASAAQVIPTDAIRDRLHRVPRSTVARSSRSRRIVGRALMFGASGLTWASSPREAIRFAAITLMLRRHSKILSSSTIRIPFVPPTVARCPPNVENSLPPLQLPQIGSIQPIGCLT